MPTRNYPCLPDALQHGARTGCARLRTPSHTVPNREAQARFDCVEGTVGILQEPVRVGASGAAPVHNRGMRLSGCLLGLEMA